MAQKFGRSIFAKGFKSNFEITLNNSILHDANVPVLRHSHLGRVRIAMVGVSSENVAPCTIGNLNGETFDF